MGPTYTLPDNTATENTTDYLYIWNAITDPFSSKCAESYLSSVLCNIGILIVIVVMAYLENKKFYNYKVWLLLTVILFFFIGLLPCYCVMDIIFEKLKYVTILTGLKSEWEMSSKEEQATLKPSNISNVLAGVNEKTELAKHLMIVGENGSGKTNLFNYFSVDECYINNQNIHVKELNTEFEQPPNTELEQPPSMTPFENGLLKTLKQMDRLHALLYCFSMEYSFTKQDSDNILQIKTKLGTQFVERHLILIMVLGDMFEFSYANLKNFDNFLKTLPRRLQSALHECQYRCIPFKKNDQHFFNNVTFKAVVEKVNQMQYDNSSYDMDLSSGGNGHWTDLVYEEKPQPMWNISLNLTETKTKRIERTVNPPTKPPITVLILGRNDHVNCLIANFVLRKEVFEIKRGFAIATKIVPVTMKFMFDGQCIIMVKGPGLIQEFNVNISRKVIDTCLNLIPKYDAIIYAIDSVPENLQAEIHTAESLEQIMGRDIFKKQGILVSINRNPADLYSVKSDPKFQSLLAKFENRVIFFNNQTSEKEDEKCQVTELINLIESVTTKV